jgi:alkyldihydroxyacetonephosphate synthase
VTEGGRRRKFWGWGFEDEQPRREDVVAAGRAARAHLGFEPDEIAAPPRLEDVGLRAPRLEPPRSLAALCSTDAHARASHSYGGSYRDVVRGFAGRFDNPPDVVASPESEDDVAAVLDWCADAGAAAIPFGGGTSVVGGVEAEVGEGFRGAVSVDMGRLDRVLELDPVSNAALIQAGAPGPVLEDQLRPHGLTLRFYPQSFERSTLGGWIATRAAGHFATLETRIDDLVESVRAVTPVGPWESRRLPGSGAGPSPDCMLLGSEGTLGVITEAWVRVRPRPGWRYAAPVRYRTFSDGLRAVRALLQAGLWPSNCRLLDPDEARITGAAEQGALLTLGFESADHPPDAAFNRALEACADHGGEVAGDVRRSGPGDGGGADVGGTGAWRSAFLRAPYLRDTLVAAGVLSETFETAITWERIDGFVDEVRDRAAAVAREVCGTAIVTARLTHAYPDGAAPYFTVLAPARRGAELEQWAAIKAAASDAILSAGGTVTHHHAVGRDHREWYDRQRPEPFAAALRAAKEVVDPAGVLNPGVLVSSPARAVV